jgi:hypothetical protein
MISAEARFDLRPTVTLLSQKLGDEVQLGASLTTLGDVVRGELSVLSNISLTNYQPASLEILPGIRIRLPQQFEIFAAIGPGLGSAPGVPAFRALLGLAYRGTPPPAPHQRRSLLRPHHRRSTATTTASRTTRTSARTRRDRLRPRDVLRLRSPRRSWRFTNGSSSPPARRRSCRNRSASWTASPRC